MRGLDIGNLEGLENLPRGLRHGADPCHRPECQRHGLSHRGSLEAGFLRYLSKPIKIKEFMATLNAARNLQKNPLVPHAMQDNRGEQFRPNKNSTNSVFQFGLAATM